jgi:hypothetical protein
VELAAPPPAVRREVWKEKLRAEGSAIGGEVETPAHKAALDALAADIAGPPSSELEQAGQAVLVRRAPDAKGIVAVAGDRGVRVADPADPGLRAFIEGNLGAAAG